MSFRKQNIATAYVLSFLSELYLPISVWLFYYLRYLDFKEVAIITAVQVVAGIVFEVPTGALADSIGRKKAIVLSFLTYSVAIFFIGFSSVFWMFIVLEILKGLSNSLYSGSLEALVYDTLKQEGKEQTFDHVVSRLEMYSWFGLFLSAIAGGYLYYVWFRAPYILQSVIYTAAALLALRLHEPVIDSTKYTFRKFLRQNTVGFKEVFKTKTLSHLTLGFITIGAGYVIAANILGISQAREYGMDARAVGFLFGIGYLVSALVSKYYPTIKKHFGTKRLLLFATGILIGSFILAKFAGVVLGSMLIIARIASSTTFRNIRSSILNQYFTSENRATAISTVVLLSQLPYAVLAYTIGDTIEASSPNAFAYILGISLLSLLCFQYFLYSFTRHKK